MVLRSQADLFVSDSSPREAAHPLSLHRDDQAIAEVVILVVACSDLTVSRKEVSRITHEVGTASDRNNAGGSLNNTSRYELMQKLARTEPSVGAPGVPSKPMCVICLWCLPAG